jgi:hypothetical protein
MKLLLMKASVVMDVITVCVTSVTESGMCSYYCALEVQDNHDNCAGPSQIAAVLSCSVLFMNFVICSPHCYLSTVRQGWLQ